MISRIIERVPTLHGMLNHLELECGQLGKAFICYFVLDGYDGLEQIHPNTIRQTLLTCRDQVVQTIDNSRPTARGVEQSGG